MAGSPIAAKYKEGEDYVIAPWGPDMKGVTHQNYQCVRCQFKTLDPAKFNDHMKEQHKNNAPGKVPWPTEDRKAEWEDHEGNTHEIKGYHPLASRNPFEKKEEAK